MSDDQKKRSVSDISHLFLSNIRELSNNGQQAPRRTPPGGQPVVTSADLSVGEYEQVVAKTERSAKVSRDGAASDLYGDEQSIAPVTMVLAGHLNERELERTREYARHVALADGPVGLIDLDVGEFRLDSIEPAAEPGADAGSPGAAVTGNCDPREIAEAVEELNADVERWIVLVPHPRTPEAKALVKLAEHWVLLCTCDHDGVVSAYRTLKSLADARQTAGPRQTRLSVAILDAAGDGEAAKVQQKLAGVCRQFLNWEIEPESPVRYAPGVAEHPLMNCRVSRDKSIAAAAPHWQVIGDFLARPRRGEAKQAQPIATPANVNSTTEAAVEVKPASVPMNPERDHSPEPVERITFAGEPQKMALSDAKPETASSPTRTQPKAAEPEKPFEASEPVTMRIAPFPMPTPSPIASGPASDEVLDLSGDCADNGSILSALLRRPDWGLVECPIAPPMGSAGVRVTVTRDRGLALLAVAGRGLVDLKAIGQAYRWMQENAGLIAMAVPQFAIDTSKTPMLNLLVDQADISGDLLRPLMQADHVTVRAYRTLRWAGRTGLLLDAA